MKIIRYPAQQEWTKLASRPVQDYHSLQKPVRKILEKVKEKGDKALLKFTKQFDGVKIKTLSVSPEEIQEAGNQLSDELKSAIAIAAANIEKFHVAQINLVEKISTMPGIECWRQSTGIEKVGLYIPGGSAPLFSTVLMLAIPAKLAGCREIILCSPPDKNGHIHPAILYTAALCGVTKIFKAGGVQAIAAMSYGTATIPKVFKIFGPGNQYVTLAKQLVQQDGLAIDMPAGPSEVLIIADESANPAFVAADLLSQAEHGPDSQAILVTPSEALADQVSIALKEQLALLPRKNIAAKALKESRILLLTNLEEAMAFSNLYAPEHLILCTDNALALSAKVTSAGSVFIGHYSPETAGDYASGTNHTLPTNGYAAMYSGVSVDSFVKKISYQQISKEGLTNIGNTIMEMAAAEGLEAHKNAVSIRLNEQL
jgi:histidinol dehydrogenase